MKRTNEELRDVLKQVRNTLTRGWLLERCDCPKAPAGGAHELEAGCPIAMALEDIARALEPEKMADCEKAGHPKASGYCTCTRVMYS